MCTYLPTQSPARRRGKHPQPIVQRSDTYKEREAAERAAAMVVRGKRENVASGGIIQPAGERTPRISNQHASGMFSDSRQFTVTGGTFTNITKNYAAPSLPSDFRMIPMGDIDLRRQIRVNEHTGVAYSHWQRACVRRMHSAKARIDGQKTRVTVAMYQGDGAEEEWQQDIAKHMSLRHPNIVQICGAASSNGIHAMLFNDGMAGVQSIPISYRFGKFWIAIEVPTFRWYMFMRVAYVTFLPPVLDLTCHKNQDFKEAFKYLYSAFQRAFFSPQCRLCTELTSASDYLWLDEHPAESPALSGIYSLTADTETITKFIDLLTLEQYHRICAWNLGQLRHFDLSASTTVNIGTVFHYSSDRLENSAQIAFLPSAQANWPGGNWTISGRGTREVMPNGWTRITKWSTWLSQANHIFRRLHIMSNFEDYVIPYHVDFYLYIPETTGDPPEGFLFLCPPEDFRTGPSSFRWPVCPAYWSLDSFSVDRLSLEEATQLGFPSFELITRAGGWYWDSSVYEGLRLFHQGKGFHPYSQDVALHLGHPLWQLSSQRDVPGISTTIQVDSDGEDFEADLDLDCNSAYIDDYESDYPTSACDDSDADAESSHSQDTVHDPVNGDGGSEYTEISNCENHNASESTVEEDIVAEEIFAPSRSFNLLTSIQLMSILFLMLSWVYDHV
ncbi:hypothetical protein C8R45DRAFT_1177713 [Mycena sanguinolenta]|nr:hypothetical protein C8R45DRAFT_1177713 [Mycena sanguinolenta]